MVMIRSRYKFYAEHVGAMILAFFAIGGILKLFVDPYDTKGRELGSVFGIVLLFIWIVFVYSIYSILKIPRISITDASITFQTIFAKWEIPWTDIRTINLIGRKKSSFLSGAEEISELFLKDGTKQIIRVEYYKNGPAIRQALEKIQKSFLENKMGETIQSPPQRQTTSSALPYDESIHKYAGNPYLSLNALIFYVFCIALITALFPTLSLHPERIPILLIPISMFYWGLGTNLNYFLLSDQQLIVKNAFFFWRKHKYPVDDLLEIVFETPQRSSHSIRVITKRFETRLYPAGGLRKKQWIEFKTHLASLNIRMRNVDDE
jgi:hypothetical protein